MYINSDRLLCFQMTLSLPYPTDVLTNFFMAGHKFLHECEEYICKAYRDEKIYHTDKIAEAESMNKSCILSHSRFHPALIHKFAENSRPHIFSRRIFHVWPKITPQVKEQNGRMS